MSAVVLTLTVFASCLFAYFGWRSLEADLVPFTLMLAGGWIVTLAGAWGSVVRMRLAWEPSIPRAHGGVLDVRFPRQWCRSLRFAGIGGAIFTIGAVMGIWAILTDEPVTWFRAGAVVFLVLFLSFLILFFISAFLSNRVRFVADGWGLHSVGPLPAASIRVAWTDIADLARRERGVLSPAVIVRTKEGRKRAFTIPAITVPPSREARAALLAEVESLRPIPEPDPR